MAVRLYAGTSPIELDLGGERISDLVLQVGYAHPARLSWSMHWPQQSAPLPHGEWMTLVDDDHGDVSTPLFEGHVHEISPRDANRVDYVAYDPTRRAGQEITVLNGPHDAGNVVPRAVFNATIDADDDYAFAIALGATVGQIAAILLDHAASELVPLGAAPAYGPAYAAAELLPLDFQPQEKVVFEGETLRGALDQLLSAYPQYRMLFVPGAAERRWRFLDVTAAPETTLVLNRFAASEPRVLAMKLERSLERRATAVRLYGPPQLAQAIAWTGAGELVPLWSIGEQIVLEASGPYAAGAGMAARRWQVADPARRRLGRVLPSEVAVPTRGVLLAGQTLAFLVTRRPTLAVSFDGGSTWDPVPDVVLDAQHGIVLAPLGLASYDPIEETYRSPTDARFYYSYHATPLWVRWPPAGFDGTAYSEAGLAHERKVYDESFAVYYENFQAVTTAERTAQFERLAQNLHAAHKDVAYAGGCTIEGLDYQFLRLGRRINFAAVDGEGAPLATGWEAIRAILTDVEYDFSERLTTLTFSSDHLEYVLASPALLKRRLKIEAIQARPSGVTITIDAPGLYHMVASGLRG